MSLILAPRLADLSTRLDRVDANLRALGHGAKGLADRWAEDLGETPVLELSSPSSGDPAKRLADQWKKENG